MITVLIIEQNILIMKLDRFILLLFTIFSGYSIHLHSPQSSTQLWTATGPHDSSCFVEGLSFINQTHLLESCGDYGRSYFHILEYNRQIPSLRQTYRSALFPQYMFAEGSILFPPNNVIYMLTYREGIVYRFNATDYTQISPQIQWKNGQGWALTHNSTHIFVNNGSNIIFIVDADFNILDKRFILDKDGNPMMSINEMEWVNEQGIDYIYSNLWPTNTIVKINLANNEVQKSFDQSKIVQNVRNRPEGQGIDVLNGIAYDHISDNFLVTGKDWPLFYVTKLDHK